MAKGFDLIHTNGERSVWIDPTVSARLNLNEHAATIGREVIDPVLDADERAAACEDAGCLLKSDPARSTLRLVDHGGRRWVVKRYRVPPLRTRVLHPVRRSPMWVERRGAAMLDRIGRRCNRPLAVALCRPIRRGSQVVLLPYVVGAAAEQFVKAGRADPSSSAGPTGQPEPERAEPKVLSDGSPLDARRRVALARQFGRQLGSMTKAGIVNRDHKLSNLIVDQRCLAGDEPIIIDPLGLRRRRSRRQVLRMFSMMVRTTHRAGPFTTREGLTLLDAALEADPSLGAGLRRPRADLARAILNLRQRGVG